ncbi:RteC domain-containing protein [Chitinophaga oryzae]|uniref:RteC domain-containing protein n=1 Tax=Chitinophaga oryzae TaxID=2725414 RepID=A0AAE6ZKV9_9BACT|nr:RteC domain-containing protein [Chitinophaga oryzae]QJB34901.1 RteC domain-containing protein [Chitinophaga oryzae]QJB41412.1 RteC domain-containing protein [Chitinophaga oryzae]
MAKPIQKIEKAIEIAKEYLKTLKDFISGYSFSDSEEQINFFKFHKPLFLQDLLYYQQLFEIESNCPIGDTEAAIAFLKGELRHISNYFDRHHLLHVYFQTGKTFFDAAMFGNSGDPIPLLNEYDLEGDGRFSNTYSYRLAKFSAYEHLASYLTNLIVALDKGEAAIPPSELDKLPKVYWKGKKAAFYEVVLGMVEAGLITGNIQTAMEYLGFCLSIKPGNYWSYFQAMRIRKKDRTPILSQMITSVTHRWDLQDEFPQQRK